MLSDPFHTCIVAGVGNETSTVSALINVPLYYYSLTINLWYAYIPMLGPAPPPSSLTADIPK